jgi:hypothetical protein
MPYPSFPLRPTPGFNDDAKEPGLLAMLERGEGRPADEDGDWETQARWAAERAYINDLIRQLSAAKPSPWDAEDTASLPSV